MVKRIDSEGEKLIGQIRDIKIPKQKDIKEKEVVKRDSISISVEAKKVFEENKVSLPQDAKSSESLMPLIRNDNVNCAKERIASSFYDEKIDDIVNNIFRELFP